MMRMLRMGGQALNAIAANTTRTVLMMLGVVIGVATLTVIASSVIGARAEVLARVEKFGLQQIGVIAGAGRKPGIPQPVCASLRLEDAAGNAFRDSQREGRVRGNNAHGFSRKIRQ